MTAGDDTRLPMPDALADQAADRLLAATGAERGRVLAALQLEQPQHADALQQLWADLCGAEGLLGSTFPEGQDDITQDIGGYRVLRKLGEGAFGTVYLCEQTTPVARQVAVKVLQPGAGDQRTLRRFGAERQLLAALNHPAITQVFDAGALRGGRPYFVMEYVDGAPIRSYCDAHALPCRERLQLFVHLCRGVAHAHSRRIVHRDLKPANVLVVDTDQGPMPKIIDFGIAKALLPTGDVTQPRTDAGRVIGTPGYMSPEQAAGRNDEVDERADVFALGVMLYELLTGELPWPHGAAATDTDVVRPSARVTTSTQSTQPTTPVQRRSRAAELRGDLDWITIKALARERSERYATVAALQNDLERHLRGETVSVGPPSLRYRLRKYVGRHRSQVAVVGGALVVLALGLGGAFAYGTAANAAIDDARLAAAASTDDSMVLLERLLARANAPELRDAPKSDGTRQALLQEALSFYDHFLLARPTTERLRIGRCRALLSIAQVHMQLGEMVRADRVAGEAVDEAAALLAAAPVAAALVAAALGNLHQRAMLGEALRQQGRTKALGGSNASARPLLAAAVEHLAACAAVDPVAHGRSHAGALRELADACEDRSSQAALARMQQGLQVLEALRRDHPELPGLVDDHAIACSSLATRLNEARRYGEAKSMLAAADLDLPAITTERNQLTTRIRRQQGLNTWSLGDRQQAIRYMQQAVEAADAWVMEQPQRLQARDYLARALRDLGTFHNYVSEFEASSIAFRRAIAAADATIAQFPEDPSGQASRCRILREFAQVLWDRFRQQDLAEAADCAERATAANDRIAASVDVQRQPRWLLLLLQAGIAESRGAGADASWQAVEAELPGTAEAQRRSDQKLLALAYCNLARWHLARHRFAKATECLAHARAAIERDQPASNKMLVDVGWLEAQLAIVNGDHTAAATAAAGIVAARTTWFAHQRAGDCLHAAWRCARTAAPAAANDYRDRAIEHYGNVLDSLKGDVNGEPLDPWYVLPWGFACIRTAEFAAAAGECGKALHRLAPALQKLGAVRAVAHADQWNQGAYRDGCALFAWLIAGTLSTR